MCACVPVIIPASTSSFLCAARFFLCARILCCDSSGIFLKPQNLRSSFCRFIRLISSGVRNGLRFMPFGKRDALFSRVLPFARRTPFLYWHIRQLPPLFLLHCGGRDGNGIILANEIRHCKPQRRSSPSTQYKLYSDMLFF